MRGIPLWLGFACASSPPPAQPDEVSMMAYNVLYDASDNDASVALIEDADPDVLCLTELRPPFLRSFEKKVGRRYPHRHVRAKKHGTWGAAIVSKHPLSRRRTFPSRPHRIPVVEATVEAPRIGAVRVACLHLIPPIATHEKSDSLFETIDENDVLRAKQAAALVRRYDGLRTPVLIVGDFNEEDGDAMRAFYDAGFTNACDASGTSCTSTWPGASTPWPAVVRIDHVVARGVRVVSAHVPSGGGSDHQPIVAVISAK
jgi:endonuclease/exonuclease/phosphatase (EEP) superfamily protein YafD